MMTPGPGAFADEKKDHNNTFLKSKQTIEEKRRESSFLHPKQTRKPTFGASSRNDRSPWSYLTNASHQGRSTPGPMRYNPRLVAVATKAGPSGTFDDQMYKDFKDYKTYITDRQHSVVVKNFKEQTYSIKKLKDRFKRGRIAGDMDRQLLEDYKRKGTKFKEYKVRKRPQSAAKAERFSHKAAVIKDPGSYLGPSDPATGAFGNAVKTAIRINDERTLELMKVRGELDKLKKNTKAYVGSKRSSTFGTSKRFVRKFPSRSGSSTSFRKSRRKRSGKRKMLQSLYQSNSDNKSSNSSIIGTIEVMKREAKLMEEKNPLSEIFLRSESNGSDNENLTSNMRERKKRQEKYDLYKLRLHSREYMMHKSVSQPSFCSPGFGTSKRFNSDKGTERSFHESMPGPGYYAKVVTGNREETNAAAAANSIPLQTTLKSSTLKDLHSITKEDIERQVEREQDLLRKRPGTFGKDRREPLSKLLNKWGAGKDVEGTPGPGDYSYMEKDTFGSQIKTMNARCQLQEELKSQLMEGNIIEKYTPNGKARTSRRRQKSKKVRPRSALERFIKKESSRRPKTAGRLSNTYKMSYNDRNGSNKYLAQSRSLSASNKSKRTEYHSPSYSTKTYHKGKKKVRPWTAGDERRLIGNPPNLDQEMASSMKRQKRPSSMTVKKKQPGKKSIGAFNWKGKFEEKSLSLYTKNDIVQFRSGLYMLVKGVATGDPGQSSSGWVEYLKTMTKTKKK